MKHLIPFRIYEAQTTSGLTPDQEAFLNKYTRGTWSVNPSTGLVDVQGDFNCRSERLESLLDISFGHVSGYFNCFINKLTSLEGAPQTVDGHFSCAFNQIKSLEGSPHTVGGYFICNLNQLTSLEGAPQMVGGVFLCDEFQLDPGKWNLEGWLEVLNTGSEEAKKLILTLPFSVEYFNKKLKEEPKAAILQVVSFWDNLPKEIQSQIQIPSNLKDVFDNLLDL